MTETQPEQPGQPQPSFTPAPSLTGEQPQPQPEQPPAESPEQPATVPADEPVVITPVDPSPAPDGPSSAEPPKDGPSGSPAQDEPVDAAAIHPSILVRLADVVRHVENFLARHPQLAAEAGADLSSGVKTIERVNQAPGSSPSAPGTEA